MRDVVFSKTEAGHSEIQTRQLRLVPRLRSLLVQIDGKHSVDSLLSMLGPGGITEEHFTQLAEAGLIASATPLPVAAAGSSKDLPAEMNDSLSAQAERQMALYRVCNEAISGSLGLMGFKLQLQLEKIGGLPEYHAFSKVVIEAVRKAKGAEAASALAARIEPLLPQ